MSMPMPKKTTGRIILLAEIQAKPTCGDRVAELLAAIRDLAVSKDEAGTHTYRTVRSEEDKEKFTVFEEYDLPNGITAHTSAAPFQALVAADIIAALKITYHDEF